jgi:hypothetical protein
MFQVGLNRWIKFQLVVFWMGFSGRTRLQWFMFQVSLNGRTRFQWFMFCVSFKGLCLNGFYHAFQAETWVGLRWCAHNDLCKQNTIYYETIGYISKIIVSWHAISS